MTIALYILGLFAAFLLGSLGTAVSFQTKRIKELEDIVSGVNFAVIEDVEEDSDGAVLVH